MFNENNFRSFFNSLDKLGDKLSESIDFSQDAFVNQATIQARMTKRYYEELINQGFTEEEALELAKNMNFNNGRR